MKIKPITQNETEPPPLRDAEHENVSITVNPPFRGRQYASNKQLSPEDLEKLEKTLPREERLLFVIVGDLNIGSRYAKSFLAVTDTHHWV